MVTLQLDANEGSLRLTRRDNSWCDVSLTSDGVTHRLGGDSWPIARDRLVRGLGERLSSEHVGELGGLPVVLVVSLFDHHGSLYAADRDDGRVLFVQAADGAPLAKLVLSAERAAAWRTALQGA